MCEDLRSEQDIADHATLRIKLTYLLISLGPDISILSNETLFSHSSLDYNSLKLYIHNFNDAYSEDLNPSLESQITH